MVELVIFDCDGVLIDSEIIAIQVESKVLGELGFAMSPENIARDFVGLSGATMRRALEERFGRALPAAFEETTRTATLATFERELRAIPGIAETLAALPWPRCVASSSDLPRIRRCLELTELEAHFAPDHLFSAQHVERGKPAPDLFLYAARRMETEPAGCVVVEDSRHGVEAARAAGMRVLGFDGGQHCAPDHADTLREAGVETVFSDMRALPALLGARG